MQRPGFAQESCEPAWFGLQEVTEVVDAEGIRIKVVAWVAWAASRKEPVHASSCWFSYRLIS